MCCKCLCCRLTERWPVADSSNNTVLLVVGSIKSSLSRRMVITQAANFALCPPKWYLLARGYSFAPSSVALFSFSFLLEISQSFSLCVHFSPAATDRLWSRLDNFPPRDSPSRSSAHSAWDSASDAIRLRNNNRLVQRVQWHTHTTAF